MRLFLIGAGAIAKHHLEAASRLAAVTELHIADMRPEAAAALAALTPGAIAHPAVGAMLAVPAQADDIVVVATPVFAHLEGVKLGFASGRHVLCEKPLAMNDAQAIEMLRAARTAGRHLGCCSCRFIGAGLDHTLRTKIENGELGALYHVTWRSRGRRGRSGIDYQSQTPWFVNRAMSGGGVLMDWGPYDIALLSEILQPSRVEVRSAWRATPGAPAPNHPPVVDVEFHVAAAMVWHTSRGPVHVDFERASCTHGPEGSEFVFEGVDAAANYEWLNWDKPNRLIISRPGEGKTVDTIFEAPMGPFHDRPLQGFAAAILNQPGPSILDDRAVFNFGVIQAIYNTAASGAATEVRLGK